jgi:small-conductance mechanosensitive channel
MAGHYTDMLIATLSYSTLVRAVAVLALAYAAARIIALILIRISERSYSHRISIRLLIPLIKFSLYALAVYYIAGSLLAFSTAELIAVSGLIGAAVGFGIKDLVAEVAGGLVIVLDKPYLVGDKITMGGYYGEVKDIGIRSTRLITPDDTLVSVPNQAALNQPVANATAGIQQMMVVVDLFIDSQSDAPKAMEILKEAVVTSRFVYITDEQPVNILLKDFPFYRRVRAKAYVRDLRKEFDFESDVTVRVWGAFRDAGIMPPDVTVMNTGDAGGL